MTVGELMDALAKFERNQDVVVMSGISDGGDGLDNLMDHEIHDVHGEFSRERYLNGVSYDITHFVSVEIERPE
jgi:hypothetical protein